MICSRTTANSVTLEKELDHELGSASDRYYGLVNFGNTCYCSSVLQALYFCVPFRNRVLTYRQETKGNKKEHLLNCLADLFYSISQQRRRVGSIQPKKFIARLKKENEVFDNFHQHDAQEFLNYLLNNLADTVTAEKHNPPSDGRKKKNDNIQLEPIMPTTTTTTTEKTWIHEIFQGTLTNEVLCLNCETTSSKDENFFDLSVEIQPNTSITHCLNGFLGTETLTGECKYYCEVCLSKQEAQKRMRIKTMPRVLAIHLKRFKYQEHINRNTKLNHRVVFPFEFRPTEENSEDADRLFDLVAVVIHSGAVPSKGHYLTCVKSYGRWFLFDDECVERIEAGTVEEFSGISDEAAQHRPQDTGYILFYLVN